MYFYISNYITVNVWGDSVGAAVVESIENRRSNKKNN